MKKIIPILLLFITSYAYTQNESCDGTRFIDDVFSEVTSTKGLKYGENTEIFGTFRELFLDVYEPANDVAENRPAIIVAFGGSFIQGTREDVAFLCEAFARKGYVAVAIDYRLFDGALFPPPSGIEMTEVVIKAVSDMKGAIRYMRQDAAADNNFRIDPNMIFTSGISAGAIAACHTAVLDSTDIFEEDLQAIIDANGGIEGTTNDLDFSSEVQGYVNYSGGLADASWMDENDPPFHSVHDEFDGTVPYGEGFASVFGIDIIYMEGSLILKETGDSLGIVNKLNTIESSPIHVSYFAIPTNAAAVINESAQFLSNIICDTPSAISEEQIISEVIFPNPANDIITIGNIENQLFDVNIYNTFGQRVISKLNTKQVDVSELRSGNYGVQIVDPTTRKQNTQIITIVK
jgi:para-nitrobenzyl esterase